MIFQPKSEQSLMTAKLFPVAHAEAAIDWSHVLWLCDAVQVSEQVTRWRECWRLSLSDILRFTSIRVERDWRWTQFSHIAQRIVERTLLSEHHTGLCSLYNTVAALKKHEDMLALLDRGERELHN